MIGAAAIATTALTLPLMTTANAQFQGSAPTQQVPNAGPQRPMGMGGMMMGGGQATMISDGNFLFILRGNQLLKVDKGTLRVVQVGELPMPEMPQMGGGFGQGFGQGRGQGQGGRGQGQTRGGNVPPPPPAK
jgi:hypothetical protein